MSKGNPSCLRFSLEESVWFQRGQEVLDLISISLDPDILIQEDEQYVTIQGALELTGEYKRNEVEIKEEEDLYTAPKFIQIVEEREEGICEFNHYFPVDITIPKNRIDQIEDIDVKVESFDYVFPERSCLKLTANLLISGLYGEQQHSVANEHPEDEEVIEEEEKYYEVRVDVVSEKEMSEEIFEPFKAEARKQPEQNEDIKTSSDLQLNEVKAVEKAEKLEQEPIEVEIPVMSTRNEESSSSSLNVFKMPKVESSGQESEKMEESPHIKESPIIAVKVEEYESEEEIPKKEEKQKKKSKKKSMSLTEFFARKEEEQVAKLKVCIVQNGDTVDMIAERYNVPVLQLLKVNHLEMNHDIKEGQVLYIPVPVAR